MQKNQSQPVGSNSSKTSAPKGQPRDMENWRPGGEPELAASVGAKGDFGIPASGGSAVDRAYVSQNTKQSDPGAAHPRAGDVDGARTAGVGAADVGPGSGSAGDIDTDLYGFGSDGGSGVSQSGPDDAAGADVTDGTTNPFASGKPAKGENAPTRIPTFSARDFQQAGPDAGDSAGADSATNPAARGDDSFASEISMDEASGRNDSE